MKYFPKHMKDLDLNKVVSTFPQNVDKLHFLQFLIKSISTFSSRH